MANKNFDGIKKLSGPELEKARKVVLNFIGEKDKRLLKKKQDFYPPARRGKSLDSLSAGGLKKKPEIISQPAILTEEKSNNKNLGNDSVQVQEIEKPSAQPSFDPLAIKKDLKSEKDVLERAARQKARLAEEKRKMKEKRIEEIKKREKMKRKKARDIEKKKRLEVRRQRRQELGRKIIDNFENSLKLFVFLFLFLLVLSILSYFIFSLLLLRFNLSDRQIIRQISRYVPVPAVVTRVGWIEYYDYLKIKHDLEKNYADRTEFRLAVKSKFIEEIVLDSLAREYGINLNNKNSEEIWQEINTNLSVDKERNKIAYSRINKIKELVDKLENAQEGRGESFTEIGDKYGDESDYISGDKESLQLKNSVQTLGEGAVSDIVITDKGYYIIKREEGKFKYIFVKLITLSEYLDDLSKKLKVWVLAS